MSSGSVRSANSRDAKKTKRGNSVRSGNTLEQSSKHSSEEEGFDRDETKEKPENENSDNTRNTNDDDYDDDYDDDGDDLKNVVEEDDGFEMTDAEIADFFNNERKSGQHLETKIVVKQYVLLFRNDDETEVARLYFKTSSIAKFLSTAFQAYIPYYESWPLLKTLDRRYDYHDDYDFLFKMIDKNRRKKEDQQEDTFMLLYAGSDFFNDPKNETYLSMTERITEYCNQGPDDNNNGRSSASDVRKVELQTRYVTINEFEIKILSALEVMCPVIKKNNYNNNDHKKRSRDGKEKK